jgi:hypothetical protein
MKWTMPTKGTTKVQKGFLWLPRECYIPETGQREIRWLETATMLHYFNIVWDSWWLDGGLEKGTEYRTPFVRAYRKHFELGSSTLSRK